MGPLNTLELQKSRVSYYRYWKRHLVKNQVHARELSAPKERGVGSRPRELRNQDTRVGTKRGDLYVELIQIIVRRLNIFTPCKESRFWSGEMDHKNWKLNPLYAISVTKRVTPK